MEWNRSLLSFVVRMKERNKMKSRTMYAIMRLSSDGHKWLDTSTLASLREEAQLRADNMDNELPQWVKNNRQIKVIEATLIYNE